MQIPISQVGSNRLSAFSFQPSATVIRTMKNFRTLTVWRRSHRLVMDVYIATTEFPREEMYGLTSQLRRSAVSIASNIAEGCGRHTDADFARFLDRVTIRHGGSNRPSAFSDQLSARLQSLKA